MKVQVLKAGDYSLTAEVVRVKAMEDMFNLKFKSTQANAKDPGAERMLMSLHLTTVQLRELVKMIEAAMPKVWPL